MWIALTDHPVSPYAQLYSLSAHIFTVEKKKVYFTHTPLRVRLCFACMRVDTRVYVCVLA